MQYPEKRQWIIKVNNVAYRTTEINTLSRKGTVYCLVALQLLFWNIQLKLVRFQAEYHTMMQ